MSYIAALMLNRCLNYVLVLHWTFGQEKLSYILILTFLETLTYTLQ